MLHSAKSNEIFLDLRRLSHYHDYPSVRELSAIGSFLILATHLNEALDKVITRQVSMEREVWLFQHFHGQIPAILLFSPSLSTDAALRALALRRGGVIFPVTVIRDLRRPRKDTRIAPGHAHRNL